MIFINGFSRYRFSLHANTATNTLVRDRLRKLVEYISRGPLSNERLEITKSGLVKLKLKTAFSDGSSHLIFTPEEFIEKRILEKRFKEKLSAIIAPPKSHLVKWSWVFAPNSPCRKILVLKPDEKKGKSPKKCCMRDIPLKNSSWSKMLAKVSKIDVTQCQHCKGDMAFVAAITVAAITIRSEVARYPGHLVIEHEAPARLPPRYQQGSFEFGSF